MGKASKADKPLTPGVGRQRRAANAAAADAATLPPHPKSGSDPTLKWLNGLPMVLLLWQILRTGMNSDAEDPSRHYTISEWHNESDWKRWVESAPRNEGADAMNKCLVGPVRHVVMLPLRSNQPLL